MPEIRNLYRVSFPAEDTGKEISVEVSALPQMSVTTVKHQVWLMLSKQGHDLDPLKGSVTQIGTEGDG